MDKIKEKLIELAGNIGEGLGLNRTTCQIYALLYLNSKPLSPSQITKELGISKGNVSINLKKLEDWNAVEKVWKRGHTRPLYKANEDIEGIIINKLQTGLLKRINEIRKYLKEIKKNIEKVKNEKLIKNKIKEIEKLTDKLEFFSKNLKYLQSYSTIISSK
ncbi:MAG: MarR family transcriptional regulator [Candidatus Omnitrophica bacterium]|nr:MarR family transcriptional regulator [Candidatus Omnitrophota bacterium]MCM8807745.1 MarR family transcriptional regulator [Candidatus Omnitrophota bacterium]